MKNITFLAVFGLLFIFDGFTQIGEDEYNKYWYYRHRLNNEFIVKCPKEDCLDFEDNGYDIPAGLSFSNFGGDYKIRWGDSTLKLGFYLGVLATEYRILSDQGYDTSETIKDLYYALQAYQRLDKYSKSKFPPFEHNQNFINGYFIRDDVSEEIFKYNTTFKKYKEGDSYPYTSDMIGNKNKPSNHGYPMTTPDQVHQLLMGFILIKKCLGRDVEYKGYNFYREVQNYARMIGIYLNNRKWKIENEKGIEDENNHKVFRREGHAWVTAKALGYIVDGMDSSDFLRGISLATIKGWKLKLGETIKLSTTGLFEDFLMNHLATGIAVGDAGNDNKQFDTRAALDRLDKGPYDLGIYAILFRYLRDLNDYMRPDHYSSLLKNAPCYGIQSMPTNFNNNHPYYYGNVGWRAGNRWERSKNKNGNPDDRFKANGLDYMLFYNLFVLYYGRVNSVLTGNVENLPPKLNSKNGFDSNYSIPERGFYCYNTIELSKEIKVLRHPDLPAIVTNRRISAADKIILKPGFHTSSIATQYPAGSNILFTTRDGHLNACGDELYPNGELKSLQSGWCSGTHTGDLVIRTQKDVDDFDYCEVTGNLIIDEDFFNSNYIYNLKGLSDLKKVGGLIINNLDSVKDLSGLDNLEEIKNSFVIGRLKPIPPNINIRYKISLESLNGLTKLQKIGRDLIISKSYYLENIDALSNVTILGNSITISNNTKLASVNGLEKIEFIAGNLTLTNNMDLNDSCGIVQLIDNNFAIGGDILIENNSVYTSTKQDIINYCTPCEGISPGDVILESQEDIDNFLFCEIKGSLTIQDTAGDITDLSNLNKLEKLGGDLRIIENRQLTQINGFNNLTTIYGTVEIIRNSNATTVSGFNNLTTIEKDLQIIGNGVKDLNGLENLSSIQQGSIKLANNFNLSNVDVFSKITSLKDLEIKNNDLSSLQGFTRLRNLERLVLNNCDVTDLEGLNSLTNISNALILYNNSKLTNIKKVKNAIKGNLIFVQIHNNDALQNLEGLENLTTIAFGVNIKNNQVLNNLDPLSNLSSITKHLEVKDNPNLESICGIVQLLEDDTAVGGTITIENNALPTNSVDQLVASCRGCMPYRGDVIIRTQADVDNFEHCVIDGNLVIQELGAAAILNIDGLSELISVTGNIIIKNNVALDNLDALSKLSSLKGDLVLSSNYNITSLGNFDQLSYIGGDLYINNNQWITDLDAFSNLTGVGGVIKLTNNNKLKDACGILKLLTSGFHSTVIYNNTPDTNSKNDIIAYCIIFGNSKENNSEAEVSLIPDVSHEIVLFPNPVKTELTIQSTEVILKVSIINSLGALVYDSGVIKSNSHRIVNMDYGPGLYMVRIKTDSGSKVKKIVIE